MKKLFLISAMVGLGLASCTQDEITSVNTSDAITFSAITTRGSEITLADLDSIYVVALNSEGSRHINNDVFRRSGTSNTFVSTTAYYWPSEEEAGGGVLDFYISNVSFADDRYIDQTDMNEEKTIAFSLPTYVDTLPDMVTDHVRHSRGTVPATGVPVTLGHRFAQVTFKAKEANPNLTFKIKGLQIYNVEPTSTFAFGDDETKASWSAIAPKDITRVAAHSLADTLTLTGTATSLMSTNGSIFLPPIPYTAWNPAEDTLNANKGTFLALDLVITNSSTGAQIFPDPDDASTDVEKFACVPLEIAWEAGKRYVYTLDFTEGAGYANPEKPVPGDDDPFEPGQLIMGGPIKFLFEVDEWKNAWEEDDEEGGINMGDDSAFDNSFDYEYEGGADAPNSSYVLYFDTSNSNRLSIGKWGTEFTSTNDMVFTKFGGVVGFKTVATQSDAWDTGDLLFNPTSTAITTYGGIPAYNKDWETFTNVSAPAYHNETNLAAGLGDICKLAGLTQAQAQARVTAGTLSVYDSGWRLPTNEEDQLFIGNASGDTATSSNPSAKYTFTTGSSYSATAPGVGNFLTSPYGSVSLPAAGYRSNTGAAYGQGSNGYYWSSTPASATNGQSLHFYASYVSPSTSLEYAGGFAVRCVRP